VVEHALPVVYRIDAADIIEDVNDAWARFAIENDAPSLATDVIGKSIWDYISGPEVRHVYAAVFKRVRKEHCQLSFPFRCDSPSLYRAMRLSISPMSEGHIEFCSVLETIRGQPRTLDILLRSSAIPSATFLKMCSWCKSIEVGSEWKPIEKAIEELSLLTKESFPTIKQSLCESCLKEYMRDYIGEDVRLASDIQDILPFVRRLFGE
jgi:hypothetical protein